MEVYRDIQRSMPIIQEQYLGPESPKALKAYIYEQFVNFGAKNLSVINWDSLESNLSFDILSRDEAIQIAALKVLPYIPFKESLKLLTSNEQLIYVFLVNRNRMHLKEGILLQSKF